MTGLYEEYRRFSRSFGVYEIPDPASSLRIVQPRDDPDTLFLITNSATKPNESRPSKPHLTLHAGANVYSIILGMAEHVDIDPSMPCLPTKIRLYVPRETLPEYALLPLRLHRNVKTSKAQNLHVEYGFMPQAKFNFRFPEMMDIAETFVWKKSSSADVKSLGRCGSGMKLIRRRTIRFGLHFDVV